MQTHPGGSVAELVSSEIRQRILRPIFLAAFLFCFVDLLLLAYSIIFHTHRNSANSQATIFFSNLILLAVLAGVLWLNEKKKTKFAAVVLLLLLNVYCLATMVAYGTVTPLPVLVFGISIFFAGAFISTVFTLFYTSGIIICLLGIQYLHESGLIRPIRVWTNLEASWGDLISFSVIFLVALGLARIYNRSVRQALHRAIAAEQEVYAQHSWLQKQVRLEVDLLSGQYKRQLKELKNLALAGQESRTLLHDLTQPLTALNLDLTRLQSLSDSEQHEFKELSRRALATTHHLDRFVQSSRQKLGSKSNDLSFHPAKSIHELFETFSYRLRAHNIQLTHRLDDQIVLTIDEPRFIRVVQNLISNSIDACIRRPDQASLIQIKLKTSAQGIILEVEDNGCGIPDQYRSAIFMTNFTTKAGQYGSGVGLALVAESVTTWNGKVEVQSSTKSGTIIRISIPYDQKTTRSSFIPIHSDTA